MGNKYLAGLAVFLFLSFGQVAVLGVHSGTELLFDTVGSAYAIQYVPTAAFMMAL